MPADVNVTEKVARALHPSAFDPQAWPPQTFGQSVDEARAEWRQDAMDDARRALAALADPEVQAGIAGVHVVHRTDYDEERREAGCECGWLVMVHPDYAAQVMADHTAAAVVEWLRGRAL